MKQQSQYDVIIVGGSYSGLAAGMTLGRAMRKVLIIDSGDPCNQQTPHSHNFLTNDGKTPKEIVTVARQQVSMYGTVSFLDAEATDALKSEAGFEVRVKTGDIFEARKLVFATGIKDIMPNIPGFAECWGITAIHCPYCHGYEVRHHKTGILANGDTAYELASLISNWTKDLTIYTSDRPTFSETQLEKLKNRNINVIEAKIRQLEHENGYIRHIAFEDGRIDNIKALYARLPFIQHSSIPQSLGCEFTAEGYIKTEPTQSTSIPGVYACGDNTTRMRTVANAVSMGTATGLMVNKELIEADF